MNYFDAWALSEAARIPFYTLQNTHLLEMRVASMKAEQERKEHERWMRQHNQTTNENNKIK